MTGAAFSLPAWAQADYAERLKLYETLQPLGDTPFGENVNMYTGELSFLQTDITLPGTGPTIVLARDFRAAGVETFADWSLTIPNIRVMTRGRGRFDLGSPGENWRVAVYPPGPNPIPVASDQRCTDFNRPYDADENLGVWWGGGYEFTTDAGQRQQLMKRHPANTAQPALLKADGTPYNFPIVTQENWQIGCLPQTSNGQIGEGFLAVSPDGTRYYLDYLVHVRVSDAIEYDSDPQYNVIIPRFVATMFVTKIEDRFGNTVNYQYQGDRLTAITASDGRSVALNWQAGDSHKIESIVVQAPDASVRTWQYVYGQYGLTDVILPDNSRWTFSGGSSVWRPTPPTSGTCTIRTGPSTVGPESTFTVQAPSGLTGTFVRSATWHARSYVPSSCPSVGPGAGRESNYPLFGTGSLIRKTFSGPGVQPLTWTYTYSPPVGSTQHDACAATNTCTDTRWVDVVSPEGDRTRHTLKTRNGVMEGKTVKVETFQGNSTLKRTETMNYAARDQGPWPEYLGGLMDLVEYSEEKNNTWTPITATSIVQDGVTYTTNYGQFDTFARPQSVTRSNTAGYSRSEATAYSDNLARWILGQTARVTCTAPASDCGAGLVLSRTDYDSTYAMPLRSYLPGPAPDGGPLRRTSTYDLVSNVASGQRGTLKTVMDGNNHVTTFNNWKRGIPQNVQYADGSTQSAVVNGHGWITSVTDENQFTTQFGHDAMGRVTLVQYPVEAGGFTWTDLQRSFQPVTGTEYGLGPGHWKQTVQIGNARKVTYYDAFWRPSLVQEYDAANQAGTLRSVLTEYDSDHRPVFVSYPSSDAIPAASGTWTSYDALGRVTQVRQNSELDAPGNPASSVVTTTAYLPGLQTQTTNARSLSTLTTYQAFDSPSYDAPVRVEMPEGAITDIQRNALGKVYSIRRHNAAATEDVWRYYYYNAYQQLCRSSEPETGITLYAYDGAENLVRTDYGIPFHSQTDCEGNPVQGQQGLAGGGMSTMSSPPVVAPFALRTYDERNRLKTLSFQGGRGNSVYTYTPDGKIDSVSTWNTDGGDPVVNQYQYNRRRMLTGESVGQPSYTWSLAYTYNTAGHLASLGYPSGLSVAYAPNALGQPTQAGSYATNVQYYPNGAIKQFTYGNGIVHTMLQNERQLPRQSLDSGGGNPLNLSYSYDGNANVTHIVDGTANARQNRDMTYDGQDRLLTTVSPMFGGTDNTARYTYDTLDNIKTLKVNNRDYAYVYDASQRLTNVTAGVGGSTVIGMSYDNQGNLSNRNGVGYVFDTGNRLRSVSNLESYRYDAHGRRVEAYSPTQGSIYSMYSQDGQLLYQSNERIAKTTAYVLLGGSQVARVNNANLPGTPALTAPTYNTTGSYEVSWNAVGNANRYELDESVGAGAWTTIQNSSARSISFSGKAANPYGYRVRACLNTICGSWSAAVQVAVEYAPTGATTLTAPANAPGGTYTVSWTIVSAATEYVLEESIDNAAWGVSYQGTARSRSFSSRPAASYRYRVKACNPAGCGPYSAIATVVVTLPPASAPVMSAPASNGTGSFNVSWTSVANTTRYELEENANNAGWVQKQDSASTSAAITGKVNGSYAYRARACNTAGCGDYATAATVTVLLAPTSAPTMTVPASNITGSYVVSWTAVATATRYELEESTGGGAWTQIQNAAGTSATLTGKPNGSYAYRARACNTGGCGGYATAASVTVVLAPIGAPTMSVPASSNTGAYTVSWSAVSTATRYELEESANGGGWTQLQNAAATSRAISGRINGSYAYRARACNTAGCGGYAVSASITVQLPPASAPTVTAPGSSTTGSFTVQWTAVAGATRYEVDQNANGGTWSTIYNGAALSTSVSGLAPATYGYRARACNTAGCGTNSSTASTLVSAVPGMPTSITGNAQADDSVRPPLYDYYVFWTAVSGATYYEVQHGSSSGTVVYNVGNVLNYDVSGRGTRTFHVRACNASGCSGWKGPLTLP